MRSARSLLKLIGKDGTAGLVVCHLEEEVKLSAQASVNIDQLLPARHHSLGSVEGRLEAISIHRRPRFTVYHDRTLKAVTCTFNDDALLEKAKDALGHRVVVSGYVRYNSKGEPLRVEAEEIRKLRTKTELPSVSELYGSDPEFTGSLDTNEYLRSMRVG